jgi:hypothetical protein
MVEVRSATIIVFVPRKARAVPECRAAQVFEELRPGLIVRVDH